MSKSTKPFTVRPVLADWALGVLRGGDPQWGLSLSRDLVEDYRDLLAAELDDLDQAIAWVKQYEKQGLDKVADWEALSQRLEEACAIAAILMANQDRFPGLLEDSVIQFACFLARARQLDYLGNT